MAVESRQQIMSNLVNSNMGTRFVYNTQLGNFYPVHQSLFCDSVQPKTSVNTDNSGLTFNMPTTDSRKRSRDSFNQQFTTSVCNNFSSPQKPSLFVGDDVLPLVQQYQLDINSIISHHTKKIRMELEERQKQQARMLVSAIGERVTKKLNEKDEEIQRIGKLNLVLQERVKSLYVENQLWRDMAQTNEATANSLRGNLEQVLAHVSEERLYASGTGVAAAAVEEDVESCCGSSDGADETEEQEVRTLAGEAQDKEEGKSKSNSRMCRRCGERESSVLLLPCRHLCLCTVCGSTLLHSCPLCNSNTNATVHVNMSS